MKKAILFPSRLNSGNNFDLYPRVVEHIRNTRGGRKMSQGGFGIMGEVHEVPLPEWMKDLPASVLEMQPQYRNYRFELPDQNHSRSLVFGRGSVPPHTDLMTGLTMLTFLGGYVPEEGEGTGPMSGFAQEGHLFTSGGFTSLERGQTVVFDDREIHSWMHNACWIFMCVPVKEVHI